MTCCFIFMRIYVTAGAFGNMMTEVEDEEESSNEDESDGDIDEMVDPSFQDMEDMDDDSGDEDETLPPLQSRLHLQGACVMKAAVSLPKALWRGFTSKCPNCGRGHLFGRFLKVGFNRVPKANVNSHCSKPEQNRHEGSQH